MSEVVFFMQASFPDAARSGRFFRAVYSHDSEIETNGAVEELEAEGVDTSSFLDPELDWEIEDCGVDDREHLRLKAGCSGESSQVIGALAVAARRAGATSVISFLFDTSTGDYQALGATEETPVEIYTTQDYDSVGDDFVSGLRRLVLAAHEHTTRLIEDGLLTRAR